MRRLLYPFVCPVCEKIIIPGKISVFNQGSNPYICENCYKLISFPHGPRCLKCSRPLKSDSQEYCQDCMNEYRFFDSGAALMLHDEVSKKIVYDLKYYNRKDNAKMLSYEATARLKDWLFFIEPDVMIPVPLHYRRQLQRGFNQSTVIALELKENLKKVNLELPVDEKYLLRTRKTHVQKELSRRQRKANIKDAFQINVKEPCGKYSGASVLLVDDVFTSGITLSECAKVLKQAGAARVYFLAMSIG